MEYSHILYEKLFMNNFSVSSRCIILHHIAHLDNNFMALFCMSNAQFKCDWDVSTATATPLVAVSMRLKMRTKGILMQFVPNAIKRKHIGGPPVTFIYCICAIQFYVMNIEIMLAYHIRMYVINKYYMNEIIT